MISSKNISFSAIQWMTHVLYILCTSKEEKITFNLSDLIEIRPSLSHYDAHNDLKLVQIIH